MVYGKSHFIDTHGEIVGRYPAEPFVFERLATFNFICQPSTFFKKRAFVEVGGLDPRLHYAFDLDLWIRIAKRSAVQYLPEFLSGYRLHGTSKTVNPAHALRSQQEGLEVALKHYDWAPANRVYGYCYHVVKYKLPQALREMRPLIIALGLLSSVARYLQMNKGIRSRDFATFSFENLKKLRIPWGALYKTY
jgi:hypothetical protein